MKKIVAGLLLAFSVSITAVAGIKTDAPDPNHLNGSWNPIDIYNETGTDIAYFMHGVYSGAVYGIQAGMVDVYHAGNGDEFAIFEVGVCKHMSMNGGLCEKYESLKGCAGNVHYNADHIKSIHVASLNSCTITCLDGTATSCRQTG